MRTANQVRPSAMTSVRLWAASVRSARLLAKIPAPASIMTNASVRKSDRERRAAVFLEASSNCGWVCEERVSIISLTNLPSHVLRAQARGDKALLHGHRPAHKRPGDHFYGCVPISIVVGRAIGVTPQTRSL